MAPDIATRTNDAGSASNADSADSATGRDAIPFLREETGLVIAVTVARHVPLTEQIKLQRPGTTKVRFESRRKPIVIKCQAGNPAKPRLPAGSPDTSGA